MIYQDVKRYLKRKLQKPSKDYEWSGHDNFLLLDFIQSRYTDEQIRNNISEIRQAFRDFFEPVGNVVVRFKEDTGVAYKILLYHVKPENSKHLEKLIDIIRSNRRNIEYPYEGREDQIALLGKIRRHINAEIIETDEAVNKKELVRQAIKQALELEERDVIVHLKRKYIVKIFQKNSFLKPDVPDPKPQDHEERRFNGYNADDMKNHYNELLDEIDLEAFLDNVMALLFSDKLNFDEISNSYYETNVLTLVRQTIAQELEQYASDNTDYLLGFAGYIFRHNFEGVHQRIAIELFEAVTRKSENAQRFLNYYSGEIYVENGKRYMIPEITTSDGKRWNITSISAIATMWLRSRDQLDKLKISHENLVREFVDLEDKFKAAHHSYEDLVKETKGLTKQYKEVEQRIQDISSTFKKELKGEMNEKKELELNATLRTDKVKLMELKKQLVKLQPAKENARYSTKGLEGQYVDLKNKKQEMETQMRLLKQNLHINSDSFHSILSSLVKALMQRKKLIEE